MQVALLNNKHSLSVLCELNRSTHLLCVVLPNPLAVAISPTNVPAFDGGSGTGRMLSETIDMS